MSACPDISFFLFSGSCRDIWRRFLTLTGCCSSPESLNPSRHSSRRITNWETSGTTLTSPLSVAVRLRPEPMPLIKVDRDHSRQEEPTPPLAVWRPRPRSRLNDVLSENGIIKASLLDSFNDSDDFHMCCGAEGRRLPSVTV